MENESTGKMERVLGIYSRLMKGHVINKAEEACRYGVDKRTIQRDINQIRIFLAEEGGEGIRNDVVYDRANKGYRLECLYHSMLTNSETLAVCKILLDSRAFTKKEMESMLQKLVDCCVPKIDQKLIQDMIRNEEFHYIELQHKTIFINKMWELAQAIHECRYVVIRYQRLKGQDCVKHRIMPAAVMFSEYYFYLTAFIDNEKTRQHFEADNQSYPTIFRIDRIQELKVLKEQFRIPYKNRFQEGEFRKKVQFMFGGKLQKVKFEYSGLSVEAILDRLPTAEIIGEENGVYTITAEVYGKGIEMWLRSQGDAVKILEMKGEGL